MRVGALLASVCVCVVSGGCSSESTSTTPPDGGFAEETPDSGAPSQAGCPVAGETTIPGKVSAAGVGEASGIVASVVNPGVYWLHNDSGDSARAFAIGADGALRATLSFDTATPTDIEDMTIEDAPGGGSFLYFGDIGDNGANRASVTIHRVAEPVLDANTTLTAVSEKMTVTYVDGSHDAESLFFDPKTRELLIATKVALGPSVVHRIGAFVAGGSATTEKVGSAAIPLATGADASRDGKRIVIRNYVSAFMWTRDENETLATVLLRTPCKYPMPTEMQGESIAFLPDGKGWITTSEGTGQDLHVTTLE